MKLSGYMVLLVILCFGRILSQDLNYFVARLPLNDDSINNQIEELSLPILYLNEDELVTTLNTESLDALKILGINYLILDEFKPGDRFFVISSKFNGDISNKLPGEQIIYKHFNSVLVKNTSLFPDKAIRSGLIVTECNLNNIFRNIRNIWKPGSLTLSDSLITQITSSVNPDSVRFFIQSLQDFQTSFRVNKLFINISIQF